MRWFATSAILLWSLFLTGSFAQTPPPPPSTYEALSKSYLNKPLTGYFPPPQAENAPPSSAPNEPSPLRLRLTAIENDSDTPPADAFAYVNDKTVSYGCEVSDSGRIHSFYHSSMGSKGGGYPQLSAEELRRLDELLVQLPRDSGMLPPNSRRLILQFPGNGANGARIYDRANPPAELLEIMRITLSGIRVWVPEFKPTAEWTANRNDYGGLAVLPGSGAMITVSQNSPLKFWDPRTQEMSREIAPPRWFQANAVALNPDGSLAVVGGRNWGDIYLVDLRSGKFLRDLTNGANSEGDLGHASFSFDGKYVFAQDTKRRLVAFDGRTGDPLPLPEGIPPDLCRYHAESGTPLAILTTMDDRMILWNSVEGRQVAELGENTRSHEVAYSPDRSMIAVASQHTKDGKNWTQYRIQVWQADSGELINDLRPFEQSVCEGVEGLQWSRDGRYVLAATKAHSFWSTWGIDVWNPRTGRHRGEFVSEGSDIQGLAFLNDGRLAAYRNDGKILIWDAVKAFEEIRGFEETLAATPK